MENSCSPGWWRTWQSLILIALKVMGGGGRVRRRNSLSIENRTEETRAVTSERRPDESLASALLCPLRFHHD